VHAPNAVPTSRASLTHGSTSAAEPVARTVREVGPEHSDTGLAAGSRHIPSAGYLLGLPRNNAENGLPPSARSLQYMRLLMPLSSVCNWYGTPRCLVTQSSS